MNEYFNDDAFELAGQSEELLLRESFVGVGHASGFQISGILYRGSNTVASHPRLPPFRRHSALRTVINLMYVLHHILLAI